MPGLAPIEEQPIGYAPLGSLTKESFVATGDISAVIDRKAALSSPEFEGQPLAPDPTSGSQPGQIANIGYVNKVADGKRDKTDLTVYEQADYWEGTSTSGATVNLPLVNSSGYSKTYSNGSTNGCYKLQADDYRTVGGVFRVYLRVNRSGAWATVSIAPETSFDEITEVTTKTESPAYTFRHHAEAVPEQDNFLATTKEMAELLDGKASTADVTLTERWTVSFVLTEEQKEMFSQDTPSASDNDYALTVGKNDSGTWTLYVGSYNAASLTVDASGNLVLSGGDARLNLQPGDLVAMPSGYILGPDDPSNPNYDKLLASEAVEEALRQGKADKPASFTTGNIAEFDANGNPTDSGIPAGNLAVGAMTRLGVSTTAANYGTAIGRNTKAAQKAVAVGACDDALSTNASGQGSVAVGYQARAEDNKPAAIAIGAYSKTKGEGAIAIGGAANGSVTPAVATADGAAQIGPGNNDKSNSLKFRDTEIVDGDGKIPAAQLSAVFSNLPELTDWEITTDNQDLDLTGAEVKLDTSSSTTYPGIVVPAISPTTPQTGIPLEIDSSKVDDLLKITAITQYGGKETTITATRARADVSYKLGDQSDKLLQPAKNSVTFPKYNGKNHKWLQAYGGQTPYSDPEIQDFNKGGEHVWSPGRRCIVYMRLHNDTGSTRHIQIYVNQRDTDHVIIDTWLNPNIGEALPVFLNADDTLMLTLGGDSSVTGYVINFSVYFVE